MKSTPNRTVVVSIVIPTYNSAAYLDSTIESVRAQTFTDWELLLVDDGSTDETVKVSEEAARRDARIRVIRADHGGVAAARNRGFRELHVQSQFVAFLDHDDTYEREAIALLMAALESHPACPAAHGLARATDLAGKQFVDDDLTESMRDRHQLRDGQYVALSASDPTSFEAELVQNYVCTTGTSLIRRTVFDSLGGFEPNAVPADDWDMNLRVARRGGFALVDRVILNWRRHPNAFSNTSRRWFRAKLKVLKRAIQSPENSPHQRLAAELALLNEFRQSRAKIGAQFKRGQLTRAARTLVRSMVELSTYVAVSERAGVPTLLKTQSAKLASARKGSGPS